MSMNKPARVWVSNDKPKAGDIVRVRAQMEHVMETGLRTDPTTGKPRARHIVSHFEAKMAGKLVFEWDLGTSIAQNPYIEFTFKARTSGDLALLWKDDQGASLTASKAITVS
ncbi:MAG: thiosulfate oxidation carrier complex protein SoxZ [Comamonas sp.]